MSRVLFLAVSMLVLLGLLAISGCDKEKIVESTEIVKEVEYVTLPPDTVVQFDTVLIDDSVIVQVVDTVVINGIDTVTITDTVIQTQTIYDTVTTIQQVYDTIMIYDTTTLVDHHYDTVPILVIDTVETVRCNPNEYTALGALQYHCDPLVMQMIQQEFGLTDGWIYYLTSNQLAYTIQSETVYDIYGYIDYWTADWSGYYPLEFNWRLTFTGTDPGDPTHWTMTDAPVASPGLRILPEASDTHKVLR